MTANHFLALQIQFHASHFNTTVCRWHLACKGLITKEIIFCVGAQPPINTGNNTVFVLSLPSVGYLVGCAKPILSRIQ